MTRLGAEVVDRDPEREAAPEAGVREEDLTGLVEPREEALVQRVQRGGDVLGRPPGR